MKKVSEGDKRRHFCPTCRKTVTGSIHKFKSHQFTHKEVKPRHVCINCSKEFYRTDTYNRHLRLHTDEPQCEYACSICNKTLNSVLNLSIHLQTHHSNFKRKQYSCKVCEIQYCENRLLVHHIRKAHFNLQAKVALHEKKLPNETWVEKVIQTNVYVQMTKLTDNVIAIKRCQHINEAEVETMADDNSAIPDVVSYSQVICDYCNKVMLKKSLINHMREIHLDKKKFNCETCNANFNRRYQMINHICGPFKSIPKREL